MHGLADVLRVAVTGGAVVAVGMAILWLVQQRTTNAGIVDAGWAMGLAFLAVWYAAWFRGGPRAWLFAALVMAWGARLAVHILARMPGHREDPRYVAMRAAWGARAAWRFFVFFETQALVDVALSVPMLLVARIPAAPGAIEYAATVLWAIAVAGEAAADRQLARFKRDPGRRGQVCDVGWWRYSRHPNYFFEWLTWIAYAAFAAGVPWGALAWSAPALMLYFLLRVTGIPLAEAQALRSRGDAYRRYQQQTSAFIPWFPRATP